jgi:HK97 family phage portal protein
MWPFSWIAGYRAKLSDRDSKEDTQRYFPDGPPFLQKMTAAGVLALPTAWACVRLRQRVVGSLPFSIFEKSGPTKRIERADHWLYGLLHDSPNAEQTPFEFWSGMVGCLDLWGNGYAEKTIGALGRTTALTPIAPEAVQVRRNRDGEREYTFYDRGKRETLPEEKMFHLRGMTLGGDVGISAVQAGAMSLSAALSANHTAYEVLSNGLQISGFMETGSHKLDATQRKDLVDIFNQFMGSRNAGKIMPLERDFKFAPLVMNPVDAELLQSRAFNAQEVCFWFDTPPILIGLAGAGQTRWGTGVEQEFLGWLATGLNPLFVSIEQAARKQLLSPVERSQLKVEINRDAMLAVDSAARSALWSSLSQNGIMTRDEIRAKENLPPMPGGDVLTVQSNLVPLDQLGGGGGDSEQARTALMKWLMPAGGQDQPQLGESAVN